ncbi:hypothetical protein ACVWXQ_005966 [Bradyrhizobium sp. S3.14.4]
MHEIIAVAADHIDRFTVPDRYPDPVEHLAHVDIDDDDAEQPVIGPKQGRRDAQGRNIGHLNHAVVDVQFDRGDADLVFCQLDRRLEEGALALVLQGIVGNCSHRSVRAGAVDAQILDAVGTDDTEFCVGRVGADVGHEARQQAVAPGLLREVIDRIDPVVEMGIDHAARGGTGAERRNVGAGAVHMRFELRGQEP